MKKKYTQKTLKSPAHLNGIGVHSGTPVNLELLPAAINHGIKFQRTDIATNNIINATYDCVSDTKMSTTLSNKHGANISTVEHLMSALAGYGITNCLIKVSGPEVPIMDGSAEDFCNAIQAVGTDNQQHEKEYVKVLKDIRVESGDAWASFTPSTERTFTVNFDFLKRLPSALKQSHDVTFNLDDDNFHLFFAKARTFGLYEDARKVQAMGLAKGANLDNTIIIKDEGILNPEGLRHPDELSQHKILDAVGDLALCSNFIIGAYSAYNGSHYLNNKLLRKLFDTADSLETDPVA
ncbi:MAG: UDP-3-O-[3-hydroxymyristoyl] N-acetylglucosamine deacetylase [Alphaproteobacteria bacterium CG_4_10_14_0_8_um_filter_37_21]|nr:MAG: UDP-3-O-[3-hydroxymyristoyl] N-acetylglucosamine deacetylase [Alphaproteobacteria bacterium CG_4_10_14_0_8_um_filter_37_21]